MAKRSQLPKSGSSNKVRPESKKRSNSGLLLGVIIAVAAVAIGAVVLIVQLVNRPIEATSRVGEGAAWGPLTAPVTVLDYSDFGCSHCASFAQNQGEQLRAEYEASGKVRFEFRYFPLSSTTADAANAAECAADQGKFWDYHDALFARQASSADPFNKSLLKQYAAQLGLSADQFNTCVDRGTHRQAINASKNVGLGSGVQATPTFFINGQKIEGAVPYATLKAAVDNALNAAK